MNSDSKLSQAALSALHGKDLIPASELVAVLLAAEKNAKKQKNHNSLADLVGTWQLCFVTGTKKTRKKAGVVLGAGKYLPKPVKITLTYEGDEALSNERGWVENCVNLPGFKLALKGPVKFFATKNILAFDFTRLKLQILGLKIYDGYLKSGKTKEANFYTESLKNQAFFTYFYLDNIAIAARGKGGGLAMWTALALPS